MDYLQIFIDMSLKPPPPLREDVLAVLDSAQKLVHWIAERQDGIEIKSDNNVRVPGVLFDLCLEHHVGIVHLVTGRMYGSAFALIRPQFEALVRALWLSLCASSEEVNSFVETDQLRLNFGQLVEAIEKRNDFESKILSGIKGSAWKAMHGYTHGGMHQVARRIKNSIIEPNFDPNEITEVLKVSGTFALMAILEIGRLTFNERVISDVSKRLSGEA